MRINIITQVIIVFNTNARTFQEADVRGADSRYADARTLSGTHSFDRRLHRHSELHRVDHVSGTRAESAGVRGARDFSQPWSWTSRIDVCRLCAAFDRLPRQSHAGDRWSSLNCRGRRGSIYLRRFSPTRRFGLHAALHYSITVV